MNDGEFYRKRAMKRLLIIGAVVVVLVAIAVYVIHSGSLEQISALETSAEKIAVNEISKNFAAPPPLIATTTASVPGAKGSAPNGTKPPAKASSYTLTRPGIITDTNTQRAENGNLPALAENTTLDDIAQIRLDDMFAKQYFAHVSPASSSAITVAQAVGYDYLTLGENLALGDFEGDQGVLTAWMNSPGHRANILDTHYTQLGVAARSGDFDGAKVWIAVQVFGRPLSDCPPPDAGLKAQLDGAQGQAATMLDQMNSSKTQLDAMEPKSGDAYTQAVNSYNAQVGAYNNFVAQTKDDITQYNTEVDTYNACIGN